MKKIFCLLISLFLGIYLFSLEPPRFGEIEKLKKDGNFEKRLKFVKKLGNHKIKIGERGEKLPNFNGLPTTGTPNIFVLLIDFPNYPHTVDQQVIKEMIFGEGNPSNYPYESLKNYYERSSYSKLRISGDLFGWYRASNNREYYTDDAETLIEEALQYYHSQGYRFEKYDNDNDGEIDYFAVFWTGPDEGWGSFWWGWQGYFYDPGYTIDGKKLGAFSWQWEDDNPSTIIHETGHALGLPDYYDYDDSVGPKGGTGGLDMMDAVWGDHNAFSKWVLGWLTPEVVTDERQIVIPPLSTTPYAVALSRNFSGESPFGEYFIIQNRYPTLNDSDFAGSGLLIHHVDSRLDCSGYTIYDNSFSEHKLLRVMEADGLEEIEKGKWGDAGDFYYKGNNDSFTFSSFPNSDLYSGISSFVNVNNISEISENMSATFNLHQIANLSPPQITFPQDNSLGVGTTPTIEWNSVEGAINYEIEIHEGVNTILKSGQITSNSYLLQSSKIINDRVYNIWIKSRGDGEDSGSSFWGKTTFSTGCVDKPFFVSKTFFDPPCFSYYSGFCYYPPTGVFVKFGGNDSNETFEYDGVNWISYSNGVAPSPRYYPAMAYDAFNQKVLLFGGYDYANDLVLGDVWSYDPRTHSWTELHPQNVPPPNWAFRCATDTKRKVVVMVAPSETYEWDGTNFKKTSSNGPNYYYGNLTYFPSIEKVVYFGGYYYPADVCKNETYLYDENGFVKISTSNPPPKRCDAVLSYNSTIGKVVLYGGSDEDYNLLKDYWTFDGTNWERTSFCGKEPPGSFDMAGEYDPLRRRLVLAKASNDTTTFELVDSVEISCEINLNPHSLAFPTQGGDGSFEINTNEGCNWSIYTDSEWITITSPTSGSGTSVVTFSVLENLSTSERSGNIFVNNIPFAVTQEGGVTPPQILAIKIAKNPFRLKVFGSNFQEGIKVYFEIDSTQSEWTNFSRKSSELIVIKKGKELKTFLKSGEEVYLILRNPDGGTIRTKLSIR